MIGDPRKARINTLALGVEPYDTFSGRGHAPAQNRFAEG